MALVTITGTFEKITGASTGSVKFTLTNYSALSVPRVAGTGIIANTSYTSVAGSSFSVALYGNDQITPANTVYQVTLFDANGNIVANANYSITGAGPYDLSNLTPLAEVPATNAMWIAFGANPASITLLQSAGGANGASWTQGNGAPTSTPAKGSLYSRLDGGVGTSLYAYNGSSWTAIA